MGRCNVMEIEKGDCFKEEGWGLLLNSRGYRGRREEILRGVCGFVN